jgi:hypothetical protein
VNVPVLSYHGEARLWSIGAARNRHHPTPRAVDSPATRATSGVPSRFDLYEEDVMKYLCMIYFEEKALDGLPRPEYEALTAEALAYDDELREGGHFVAAQALQPVATATTLRIRHGAVSTTDGPFAETKEQLGGFILIEARDLNEAIQLAARIPPARLGGVEVRPVKELRRP